MRAVPYRNKTLNYEFEAKMKILSYSKLGRTLSDCAVASNASCIAQDARESVLFNDVARASH